MIFRLVLPRIIGWRNRIIKGDSKQRFAMLRGGLVSLFIFWVIWRMTTEFIRPMAEFGLTEQSLLRLLENLPAQALFWSFWVLVLSSITVGMQVFYLSNEIPLLLTAPISPSTVFVAKLVDATAINAALFMYVGLPVGAAYLYVQGLFSVSSLLTMIFALTAFSAIPAAIGSVASILLMRVLPVGRFREAFAAFGMTAFAAIYFFVTTRMTRIKGGDPEEFRQRTQILSTMMRSGLGDHGPWAWAASLVRPGAQIDKLLNFVLLTLTSLISVAIAATIARGLYSRGWLSSQEGVVLGNTSNAREPKRDMAESFLKMVPMPVRAVLLKDFRTLMRDMRQMSMLFIPISVVGVFLFNLSESRIAHDLEPLLLVQGLYFVLAPVCLRISTGAFVGETSAFWLVLTSPNNVLSCLMGKFLYSVLLSLPIGIVATVGFSVFNGIGGGRTALSLFLSVLAMTGFSGIGVGGSALFVNVGTSPINEGRFGFGAKGRLLMFGMQLIYFALLVIATWITWFLVVQMKLNVVATFSVSGIILMGIATATAVLPLMMGARRITKLEWGEAGGVTTTL